MGALETENLSETRKRGRPEAPENELAFPTMLACFMPRPPKTPPTPHAAVLRSGYAALCVRAKQSRVAAVQLFVATSRDCVATALRPRCSYGFRALLNWLLARHSKEHTLSRVLLDELRLRSSQGAAGCSDPRPDETSKNKAVLS